MIWQRRAAWALFALLGLWVGLDFASYGISNDEPVQHAYGRMLWDWYLSGFTDDSAFRFRNLYLYGGLFDLLAAGLEPLVPLPVHDLRHLLSALFGLAGMAAVYRIAVRLGDARGGVIAVALLAVAGMWGGAMFTHTKDVPFAAAMAWSLYYTLRVAARLPAPPLRLVLKLGLAVGCAFGLRVGAAFAVLDILIAVVAVAAMARRWAVLGRSVVALLPAAGVAIGVMAVTWPWSVMGPTHLIEAMTTFSHFAFDLRTVLAGREYAIGEVPGTYLPVYLAVKLPGIALLGLLCAAALVRRPPLGLGLVVAAAGVPVAYAALSAPPLYNGLRHFLFVVPPLMVLAGLGLSALARWGRRHPLPVRVALAGAVAAVAVIDTATVVRLHPYQYTAYNRLAGEPARWPARWEGDYWAATVRAAAAEMTRRGLSGTVAVCAETEQAAPFLGPGLTVTRDWPAADFYLAPNQTGCRDGLPGGTVLFTIDRLGIALATVTDRRALPRPARAER